MTEDHFTTTEHDAGRYEARRGESVDTPEPADREASFTAASVKPSYLPTFGPHDCLWLVTVRNQWAVHAHTSEVHAMYDARTRQDKLPANERDDVRVTRVTIADYQPLEYRREVIEESLVEVSR